MRPSEFLGQSAGNLPAMLAKVGAGVAGLGMLMKIHESVETDERGIILNRGRVKIDRSKIKRDFGEHSISGGRSIRRANRILAAQAIAHGATEDEAARIRIDPVEYAAMREPGGCFTFFSIRSLRTIGTKDITSGIPAQRIKLQKRGVYLLDSSVTWQVDPEDQNPARAMLRAGNREELEQRIVAKTAAAARESILALDSDDPDVEFTSGQVFEQVQDRCGEALLRRYGAVLLDYDLMSSGASEAETGRTIRFEDSDGSILPPDEIPAPVLSLVTAHHTNPETGA